MFYFFIGKEYRLLNGIILFLFKSGFNTFIFTIILISVNTYSASTYKMDFNYLKQDLRFMTFYPLSAFK